MITLKDVQKRVNVLDEQHLMQIKGGTDTTTQTNYITGVDTDVM